MIESQAIPNKNNALFQLALTIQEGFTQAKPEDFGDGILPENPYEQAAKLYRIILKDDPTFTNALFNLAVLIAYKGVLAQAEDFIDQIKPPHSDEQATKLFLFIYDRFHKDEALYYLAQIIKRMLIGDETVHKIVATVLPDAKMNVLQTDNTSLTNRYQITATLYRKIINSPKCMFSIETLKALYRLAADIHDGYINAEADDFHDKEMPNNRNEQVAKIYRYITRKLMLYREQQVYPLWTKSHAMLLATACCELLKLAYYHNVQVWLENFIDTTKTTVTLPEDTNERILTMCRYILRDIPSHQDMRNLVESIKDRREPSYYSVYLATMMLSPELPNNDSILALIKPNPMHSLIKSNPNVFMRHLLHDHFLTPLEKKPYFLYLKKFENTLPPTSRNLLFFKTGDMEELHKNRATFLATLPRELILEMAQYFEPHSTEQQSSKKI